MDKHRQAPCLPQAGTGAISPGRDSVGDTVGRKGHLPEMDYGVITFTSTYGAIYAQKVLRPVAEVLAMPVLRELSLGCGIALRVRPEELAAVRAALASSSLGAEEYAFYGITGTGAALRAQPLGPGT